MILVFNTPVVICFPPFPIFQGDLVYANYGEEADFVELRDKNVTCNGCVIIMRYGRVASGVKVSDV